MKKLLIFLGLLLLLISPFVAYGSWVFTGGAGLTCTVGAGTLTFTETSDDYQPIYNAADDYQEVDNNVGTITICKVVIDEMYTTDGSATFKITIRDSGGTPVANGESGTETTTVATAGETLTFEFSTNPVVSGDFQILIDDAAGDGGYVRTDTSNSYTSNYDYFANGALQSTSGISFTIWYMQ